MLMDYYELPFNAIGIETANADGASVCQIGIVHVERGRISGTWETLIDPQDAFDSRYVNIHGIDASAVSGSPTIGQIYDDLYLRLHQSYLVSPTMLERIAFERAVAKYEAEPWPLAWLDSAGVAEVVWPGDESWGPAPGAHMLGLRYEHRSALDDARAVAEFVLRATRLTGHGIDDWVWHLRASSSYRAERRCIVNEHGGLFGHRAVFAGELTMLRDEAALLAANAGVVVEPDVSAKTTMLVVGTYKRLNGQIYGKWGDHVKAEASIANGQEILILSDADFRVLASRMSDSFGYDPLQDCLASVADRQQPFRSALRESPRLPARAKAAEKSTIELRIDRDRVGTYTLRWSSGQLVLQDCEEERLFANPDRFSFAKAVYHKIRTLINDGAYVAYDGSLR